jgi:hypothetical protein
MPIVAALIIWMFGIDIKKSLQKLGHSSLAWIKERKEKSRSKPVEPVYELPERPKSRLAGWRNRVKYRDTMI